MESFNAALQTAGFSDLNLQKIPKKEVSAALQALYEKYGHLTYNIARKELKFDLSVVVRVYGSWSKALAEVVGVQNTFHGVPNEIILKAIRDTELVYGKATGALLSLHTRVSKGLIVRRFGSSRRAYELAGVVPIVEPGLQRWVFRLIERELKEKILREKTFPWLKSPRGGAMRVDGYISSQRLCLEFDGLQHDQFVKLWHGSLEYFEYRKECDALKERLLLEHGLKLVRFRWDDNISAELVRHKLAA